MKTTSVPRIATMSPQFLVADIDGSIAFYTQHLGFRVDFRHEDFYAGISRDGHSIHLKTGTLSAAEMKKMKEDEHLNVVFGVMGIDDLWTDISSHPVEITQPLRTMPYGREFYVSDPDGYILGFIESNKT